MKNMPGGGKGGVSAGGVSAIICWLMVKVFFSTTVEYDVLVAGFRQKCVHLFHLYLAV
jgi:hypothetical protein